MTCHFFIQVQILQRYRFCIFFCEHLLSSSLARGMMPAEILWQSAYLAFLSRQGSCSLHISIARYFFRMAFQGVCMYVYTYACMHACMYVCLYVCICICTYTCIHIFIYIYRLFRVCAIGMPIEASQWMAKDSTVTSCSPS